MIDNGFQENLIRISIAQDDIPLVFCSVKF